MCILKYISFDSNRKFEASIHHTYSLSRSVYIAEVTQVKGFWPLPYRQPFMVFNRLLARVNFCTEGVFRRGLVESEDLYVLKIAFVKNDSTASQRLFIFPLWWVETLSLFSGVVRSK
jgi:hypothetical protein